MIWNKLNLFGVNKFLEFVVEFWGLENERKEYLNYFFKFGKKLLSGKVGGYGKLK